jgi:hypothetical protein
MKSGMSVYETGFREEDFSEITKLPGSPDSLKHQIDSNHCEQQESDNTCFKTLILTCCISNSACIVLRGWWR